MKKILSCLFVSVLIASFMIPVLAVEDYELGNFGSWGIDAQNVMELEEDSSIPVDTEVQYEGNDSFRFTFENISDWYIGLFFMGESHVSEVDVTPFEDGYIQLAVKGENGGETLGVGFKSGLYEEGTEVTALFNMVGITTEWQLASIPVAKYREVFPDLELDKINGFQIRGGEMQPGTIWVSQPMLTMEKRGVDLTIDKDDPFYSESEQSSAEDTEVSSAPEKTPEDAEDSNNTLIIVLIGAAVVILIIAGILFFRKK